MKTLLPHTFHYMEGNTWTLLEDMFYRGRNRELLQISLNSDRTGNKGESVCDFFFFFGKVLLVMIRCLSFQEFQPSAWPMTGRVAQRFAHYPPWIATSPGYCNQCPSVEEPSRCNGWWITFYDANGPGRNCVHVSQILSPFKNLIFNVLHVTF